MRRVIKVTASVDNQQGTCHSHYHPPQCPLLNMESHYSPLSRSGELGSAHICAILIKQFTPDSWVPLNYFLSILNLFKVDTSESWAFYPPWDKNPMWHFDTCAHCMLLEAYQASFSPPTFLHFFILKIYKKFPTHILEVHSLLSFQLSGKQPILLLGMSEEAHRIPVFI